MKQSASPSRSLVSCLMLMVLFMQGIAAAGAGVLAAAPAGQAHCQGHDHEKAGQPCACCSDHQAMNSSCASACPAAAVLPSLAVFLPHQTGVEHSIFVARFIKDPAYLPLNPPPIS